jgi:hypothetical protein
VAGTAPAGLASSADAAIGAIRNSRLLNIRLILQPPVAWVHTARRSLPVPTSSSNNCYRRASRDTARGKLLL